MVGTHPTSAALPPDAFRAYEENIGVLSPMIRENILSALEDFTDEDITYAVRIAVENESRSWSFVAGVLRRWLRDGVPDERNDGQSRGTADRGRVSETELRKYLEEQRKRSRSERVVTGIGRTRDVAPNVRIVATTRCGFWRRKRTGRPFRRTVQLSIRP